MSELGGLGVAKLRDGACSATGSMRVPRAASDPGTSSALDRTTATFATSHPQTPLRNCAEASQTRQMEAADSISSQDPNREDSKKTKSRRPPSKPGHGRAHTAAILTAAQIRRFDSSD